MHWFGLSQWPCSQPLAHLAKIQKKKEQNSNNYFLSKHSASLIAFNFINIFTILINWMAAIGHIYSIMSTYLYVWVWGHRLHNSSTIALLYDSIENLHSALRRMKIDVWWSAVASANYSIMMKTLFIMIIMVNSIGEQQQQQQQQHLSDDGYHIIIIIIIALRSL